VTMHKICEYLPQCIKGVAVGHSRVFISRVSHLNMCCLITDRTAFFAKKCIEIMHLVVVTSVSLSKFFTGFYKIL